MQLCTVCNSGFLASESEVAFRQQLGFPAPASCPDCRRQQRLVFRNEWNLYRRKCDATGKDIVSIFSQEKKIPVYSQEYWWSDNWSALDYGKDFDFGKSFFEQFAELYAQVPQLALNNSQSQNSVYTNQSQNNKSCYLITASNYNEDCLYGAWFQRCKDCSDCLYIEDCELCYEVLNGTKCYNCSWCENIETCDNCHFCKNCIGCSDCFGCINLRNKQYCIFNEQYSKEAYFQKIASLKPHINQLEEFYIKHPHKFYVGKNTENFTGDYVQMVKNSYDAFNCRHSENVKYCTDAWNIRNCQDLTETLTNDYCLELEGCSENVSLAFSMKNHQVSFGAYNILCFSSKNIFGCVGLRSTDYCILNKKYSKEEYNNLMPKIVEHMKKTGEWGRYFPAWISPFGYNETVASEYFELSKEEALKNGYNWYEKNESIISLDNPDTHICNETGKAFKVIPQEKSLYARLNIQTPSLHPEIRFKKRMAKRNPRKLWSRACLHCGVDLESTFAPSRKEFVYCESCYLAKI